MDIENKGGDVVNFDFPSKPETAEFCKVSTVNVETNHFPLKFDTSRSHVYQYHLKILPEIPEDSRTLRQNIISECSQGIRQALDSDFYSSGYNIFGSK